MEDYGESVKLGGVLESSIQPGLVITGHRTKKAVKIDKCLTKSPISMESNANVFFSYVFSKNNVQILIISPVQLARERGYVKTTYTDRTSVARPGRPTYSLSFILKIFWKSVEIV